MKYKVKSTLHHNGAVYQEGSEIELSDIYAAPLLAVDVIEPIPVVVEPVKETVGLRLRSGLASQTPMQLSHQKRLRTNQSR